MGSLAVLGSGRVGMALASGFAAAGHAVVVGSRDPRTRRTAWSGAPVDFDELARAIRRAEVVVNATPGDSSVDRLSALRDDLGGKILIDVANASRRGPDGIPQGLLYPGDSLAERLQSALPRTRVVKTLNTMASPVMTAPRSLSTPPTAFLSGDDAAAKAETARLLGELGWPADWIVDLGGIATARGTEAVMLLAPGVLRACGPKPFALTLAT